MEPKLGGEPEPSRPGRGRPAWQTAERSGRTGPDGRLDLPLFGAEVQADAAGESRGPRFLRDLGSLGSSDRTAGTDAAGDFTLSGLAAGTIDLTVKADG